MQVEQTDEYDESTNDWWISQRSIPKPLEGVSIIMKKILEKWKELEYNPSHFLMQKSLNIDVHNNYPAKSICYPIISTNKIRAYIAEFNHG